MTNPRRRVDPFPQEAARIYFAIDEVPMLTPSEMRKRAFATGASARSVALTDHRRGRELGAAALALALAAECIERKSLQKRDARSTIVDHRRPESNQTTLAESQSDGVAFTL